MGDREHLIPERFIINPKNMTARLLLKDNEVPPMLVKVFEHDYIYTGIVVEKHLLVTHTYAEYIIDSCYCK